MTTFTHFTQQKYGKVIQDMKQPILISRPKEKSIRGGDNEPKWLIPELCLCTGLSELQRKDIAYVLKKIHSRFFIQLIFEFTV